MISDINDLFDLYVLQVATSVCRKTKALFSADVDLPLLCAFMKQMDTFEDITIVNDLTATKLCLFNFLLTFMRL